MSIQDTILSRIRGSSVASISFTKVEDEWLVNGLVLASKEKELSIQSTDQLSDPQEISSWLAKVKQWPLVVSVQSDEVLTRKVGEGEYSRDQLLKQIIPQARPEDFFLQQLPGLDGVFLSLIRRAALNNILEIIPADNQVAGIYLSPLVLTPLARALKKDQVQLAGFELGLNEGKVLNITHLEEAGPVELAPGEYLEPTQALSYCAAFTFLSEVSVTGDFDDKAARHEYIHKRLLHKLTPYVLGVLFLIFLINTVVFMQLSQENEQLIQENSSLLSLQKELDQIEGYVLENQELLNGSRKLLLTRFSDELGHSVPPGIQLNEIEINPLYLDQKRVVEQQPAILIVGYSENALAYANWIEQLKNFTWVQGIAENTFKQGSFELKIVLSPDV